MPEITADQLADILDTAENDMDQMARVNAMALLASKCVTHRHHIIACLREHEQRAAVDRDTQCDRHWIAGANFGWSMGNAQNHKGFVNEINSRRREIVAATKAAAEKTVRRDGIPLVRCECVDSNGNPRPDCTCDQGWRLPVVEKAVRNG